jgi:hypothetical protein
VFQVEVLQTSIRIAVDPDLQVRTAPWFLTANPTQQIMEGNVVVQRLRKSTQVVETRKAGSLLRSSRFDPGSSTGITRNSPLLWLTRRSIAASISSLCQRPKPFGPMNTAHAEERFSPLSRASCHAEPGTRFHLSNHGFTPALSGGLPVPRLPAYRPHCGRERRQNAAPHQKTYEFLESIRFSSLCGAPRLAQASPKTEKAEPVGCA